MKYAGLAIALAATFYAGTLVGVRVGMLANAIGRRMG